MFCLLPVGFEKVCVMHLLREGGRKEGIPEKGRYLDQIQNGFLASWAGLASTLDNREMI